MRVAVLYFASLRERAGTPRDELDLPPGATLGQAVAAAERLHPGLAPLGTGVRFARNLEFADRAVPLADGDEIALLPPVSGG